MDKYLEILENWFKEKRNIHGKNINSDYRYKKGEVWYIDFGINIGNEFNKKRPAVVITNTSFSKGNNLIVIPITTFKSTKNILGTDIVLEDPKLLKFKSILRLNHLRDISKKRFMKKIGRVNDDILNQIDEKLIQLFDIRK